MKKGGASDKLLTQTFNGIQEQCNIPPIKNNQPQIVTRLNERCATFAAYYKNICTSDTPSFEVIQKYLK